MGGGKIRCLYLKYYRDCDQPKRTEWVTFGDSERKRRMAEGSIPMCLRDVKVGGWVKKLKNIYCDLSQRSGGIPEQNRESGETEWWITFAGTHGRRQSFNEKSRQHLFDTLGWYA